MPYADKEKNRAYHNRKSKEWYYSKMKGFFRTPERTLRIYKSNAKTRSLEFDLSLHYFNELLHSKCHYCGIPEANGVDRLDSNEGYKLGNVVACCKVCNWMKRDYSYEEFILHIKKIVKNIINV